MRETMGYVLESLLCVLGGGVVGVLVYAAINWYASRGDR